jgi:Helicase conserved C-terminal domain
VSVNPKHAANSIDSRVKSPQPRKQKKSYLQSALLIKNDLVNENTATMADEQSLARKLTERATKRVNELTSSGKNHDGDGASIVEADFSHLALKPDHIARPCWVCPDGTIYLEAFHDLYAQAYDFLVAIAEPVARPEFVHQYKLTPFTLYAAVATNIETKSIITVLERLSKNKLPTEVDKFIKDCTSKYGKVKLVLRHNKFYVESEYPSVLKELLRDKIIDQARVKDDGDTVGEDGFVTTTKAEEMKENLTLLRDPDEDSDDDDDGVDGGRGQGGGQPKTVVSFQVRPFVVSVWVCVCACLVSCCEPFCLKFVI